MHIAIGYLCMLLQGFTIPSSEANPLNTVGADLLLFYEKMLSEPMNHIQQIQYIKRKTLVLTSSSDLTVRPMQALIST